MNKVIKALLLITVFSFYSARADEGNDNAERLQRVIKEFREISECLKDSGTCLRKCGMNLRDIGYGCQKKSREELRKTIEEYENEIKNNLEKMTKEKSLGESGQNEAARNRDPKLMDVSNEKVEIWNRFIARWTKILETINRKNIECSISSDESKKIVDCGTEMMNDGLYVYFRGCDFEIEADIYDEYGFEISEADFKKMLAKRKNEERGE